MKFLSICTFAVSLGCAAIIGSTSALAQTQAATRPDATADYIVALVNSEPVTDTELRAAIRRVTDQLRQQGQPLPPAQTLRQGVLERLINDRAQLQFAAETGLKIDDAAVDMAEQNLARQYQVSVEGLHQQMAMEGLTPSALRSELRDQLTLGRLREREVDARVQISDQDVDRSIAQQQAASNNPMSQEINLAQLLIAVPEKADAAEVAALQAKAQSLLERLRAGENFAELVQQFSAADRSNGGAMGLRRADRYPVLFVQATRDLAAGAYSDLVRSGAGFHILRLIDRRQSTALAVTAVQSHARHILLRTGEKDLTQKEALARMADYRQRILAGTDTFQDLARKVSQDGSADHGGDLGWSTPGMFVPEFEEVLGRLREGEISQPLVSRFGVHLIQLLERRTVELNPREIREMVRKQLRDSKAEEAYANWAREIRARAYVELRDNVSR